MTARSTPSSPSSGSAGAAGCGLGASWNPKIVVFACNWCSYAGADTAGVSRIEHQPHFRMIRVMCSGRIQPAFVLRAFEQGADGVLVSGCHFGDCHYIFGNEFAVKQFEKTKAMVKLLGIEEGRLRLEWISAAEGARFAAVINEFTDQVRALGPSGLAPAPAEELEARA
jgi:F420-non-reducing hydrogenase iron-sulfur subunit